MTDVATKITLEDIQHNFALDSSNCLKLDEVMDDSAEVLNYVIKGQNYISIAAADYEENNQSEQVAELDGCFRQLMDLERRINNQNNTVQTLKARVTRGEKIAYLLVPYENIQQQLLDKTTSEESKYLRNTKYVNYRQSLWSIHHPDELMPNLVENNDDDDIVMGSTKISMKCPLTTTWFEEPVTSDICKHTFSKAAIMGLLRQNGGQMSCPVAGCNKYIKMSSFAADDLMADRVARSRARDERNKATATQFFDVE